MPPTSPLCRRAVQCSLRSSPDNIWITDDILVTAFQRFCAITKPSRRHGSSVPGPMECRRRAGKRKMTHLVEAGNTPMFDVRALFRAFDTVDRTEWTWMPPTARSEPQKEKSKLSILDIETTPLSAQPIMKETSRIQAHEEEMNTFLKKIRTVSKEEIELVWQKLNHDFKQGLLLGEATEDVIISALQLVPRKLVNTKLIRKQAPLFCLEFFKSILNGYQACKVLRIQDVGGHVFGTLLCGLAKLREHQDEIEAVSIEILRSVSAHQIEGMSQGMDAIVEWWAVSWLNQSLLVDNEMKATPSVLALSTLLGYLPQEVAEQTLPRLTEKAIMAARTRGNTNAVQLASFKRSWMLMVANLSNISENTFVQTWQTLNSSMKKKLQIKPGHISPGVMPFNGKESVALVIEYWINHGQFKNSEVRGSYMFKRQNDYHGHVADLLAEVDRRRDGCWTQTRGLFALFRRVQMDKMIPTTLKFVSETGLKVPASLLASEIRELSLQNKMNIALKVYKAYPSIRFDNVPLGVNGLHEMIIGLIKDPAFHPLHVWGICGIHLNMPGVFIRRPAQRKLYYYRKPSKPLEDQRIILIKKMAEAFAHAKHLYSSASNCPAYRNVRQCIRYLFLHNVKPCPEISRALVHIGVVKPLMAGHGPATKRLCYILAYVKEAEGEAAAYAIDSYVQRFRDLRMKAKTERRRVRNPLRLGLID